MSADSTHRCPRDGSSLISKDLDGVVLWSCERCQGLLLEPPALEVLKALALGGHAPPRSAPQANIALEGTVRCICEGSPLMTNVTKGPVVFDLCLQCGSFWLDGGEVADFLRPYAAADPALEVLEVLLTLLISLP
jgi:Zn-finger nucleic acid-binding protein